MVARPLSAFCRARMLLLLVVVAARFLLLPLPTAVGCFLQAPSVCRTVSMSHNVHLVVLLIYTRPARYEKGSVCFWLSTRKKKHEGGKDTATQTAPGENPFENRKFSFLPNYARTLTHKTFLPQPVANPRRDNYYGPSSVLAQTYDTHPN